MTTPRKLLIPRVPFALDGFHDFCGRWSLVFDQKWEISENQPAYEELWYVADQSLSVSYLEDSFADFSYIVLVGYDKDNLSGDFINMFPVIENHEMLESFGKEIGHNGHVKNLFRMSIAFESYDSEAAEIFQKYAVDSENAMLRRAAIAAMSRRAWPQLKPTIKLLASNDLDAQVRSDAGALLPLWPSA